MDIALEQRLHSMEEGIAVLARDINIIKAILIVQYAENRGLDAKQLSQDLLDIYSNHDEQKGDD